MFSEEEEVRHLIAVFQIENPRATATSEDFKSLPFGPHPPFPIESIPNPYMYEMGELCEAMVSNSSKPKDYLLSKLSAQQRISIGEPLRRLQTQTPEKLLLFLNEWYSIFDKLFFFGSLAHYLQPLEVYSNNSDNVKGKYSHIDRRIAINLIMTPSKQVSSEQTWLCTLLHEMLHAFFREYSCGYHPDFWCKCAYQKLFPRMIGMTGHGSMWCQAMISIQRSLEKLTAWEKINCGMDVAIRAEMRSLSCWQPSQAELESYDLQQIDKIKMSRIARMSNQAVDEDWDWTIAPLWFSRFWQRRFQNADQQAEPPVAAATAPDK